MKWMPKLICAVSFLLICQQANATPILAMGATQAIIPATQTATVTANLGSTSFAIPSNFVGFSEEEQDLIRTNFFSSSNTSLISLIQLLGSNGYWRWGADSCDYDNAEALTQTIANNLQSFISALGAGWRASYCVDLQINSTANAVTQAGLIINAFGVGNVDFEVGNEPEGYLSSGAYGTEFAAYYSALTAAYPTITINGPSNANSSLVQTYLGATGVSPSALHYVTQHFYLNYKAPLVPTIAQVNASLPNSAFTVNLSYASGKNRINESNGVWAGGALGFSDRLSLAYWYLREASYAASLGIVGLDYHNSLTPKAAYATRYNSFAQASDLNWVPTPVFYGEYLFSKLEGQTIVSTTNTNLDSNATVIATTQSNGYAQMIITNGNPTTNIAVVPSQSSAWSNANVWLLSGSTCYDPNVNINGSTIGESGSWSGTPVAITNGQSITIPPCGAALVQITS